MKEIIVRIKYDENRMQIDSSFVLDALMEYTKGDGIIDAKEFKLINSQHGKLVFEDLYVGMIVNVQFDKPQEYEIVEINYEKKGIIVKDWRGFDFWDYEFIKRNIL